MHHVMHHTTHHASCCQGNQGHDLTLLLQTLLDQHQLLAQTDENGLHHQSSTQNIVASGTAGSGRFWSTLFTMPHCLMTQQALQVVTNMNY